MKYSQTRRGRGGAENTPAEAGYMDKKRGKHGENSYLNDFHRNLAGEYVYSGAHYAVTGGEAERAAMKRALWARTALLAAATILSGCFSAPGMRGCFYVILPYAGELICVFLTVWGVVRLGTDWIAVREYVYDRSVRVLPARAACAALFAALGAAGELVFLVLSPDGGQLLPAAAFLLLRAAAALAAAGVRRLLLRSNWCKMPENRES